MIRKNCRMFAILLPFLLLNAKFDAMKSKLITLATVLLVFTVPVMAAKKGRVASPPPSKSNVAAETKATSKKQTATRSTVTPQDSPITRKAPLETIAIPELAQHGVGVKADSTSQTGL